MEDRLDTLAEVRRAGINVCSAALSAWAKARADRVGFIHTLATLPAHSRKRAGQCAGAGEGHGAGRHSGGHPLAKIDDIEFVRTIAVARITMPMSMVRLSAGRESMSEATQALCFMGGREQHLHWRQIADGGQCRRRQGRGVDSETGAGANGG